jgi:hypothetical protein
MMRLVRMVLGGLILGGCSIKPLFELIEPTGSARETLNSYKTSCLEEARIVSNPLNDEDRTALGGRATCRLFMNGHPSVTQGGNPAMHGGFIPCTSNEFTDRYALCYLKRGYTWREQ